MGRHGSEDATEGRKDRLPIIVAAAGGVFVLLLIVFSTITRSEDDAASTRNDFTESYGGATNLSAHEVAYFKRLDSFGVHEWRSDKADFESDIQQSCEPLDQGKTSGEVVLDVQARHGYSSRAAQAIVATAIDIDCPSHK